MISIENSYWPVVSHQKPSKSPRRLCHLIYIACRSNKLTVRLFRTALSNVNSRYQDILALESSIAELHQMMLDIALLTEQQGEYLDQIEYHIKSAGDQVEEGNEDMHKAIRYLKKVQKKRLVSRYVCELRSVICICLWLLSSGGSNVLFPTSRRYLLCDRMIIVVVIVIVVVVAIVAI